MILTSQQLAGMIDHTMLKIDCSYDELRAVCYEAIRYNFAAVAVNPANAALAKAILKHSPVAVCTAIGFYSGAFPDEVKRYEALDAVKRGADELDMIINIGALKEHRYDVIEKEIKTLVAVAEGRITKIVLETCLLTVDEIEAACKIALDCRADFVKTSTGFGNAGAKVEHVRMMRNAVGRNMGVKAAGGIHNLQTALDLIRAGADRLGASSSVRLIEEYRSEESKWRDQLLEREQG